MKLIPKNTPIVAKIFIFNEKGEVLMLQRSARCYPRPLGWDLPGGKVGSTEDPQQSVLRELYEEAGLEADESTILYTVTQSEPKHIITMVYRGNAKNSDVALSWEHSQYRWVKPSEVVHLDMPAKYHQAAALL